jgi:hypothetical protein
MVMSHEMRTPLNPIMGFADLLANQIEDKEQLTYLEQIRNSADQLAGLIGDILDLSSIEAGRTILAKEPIPVVRVIFQAVELLRKKAVSKGLKLEFEDNGLLRQEPALTCYGDKRKIRQVVLNLANNAIKFTRRGSVRVEYLPPVIEDGIANLCIRVSDTGIGIEADQLESIFERFYQVSMNASREFGGQGLGLTLSRELARQMEGNISVASTPGEGSVFAFTLRLELVEGRTDRGKVDSQEDADADLFSGLKVLVVEDDPVNRMIMGKILTRLKVNFQTANDGLQALEKLKAQQFDLILMDIQMPRMDGIEATRRIRQGGYGNPAVPIAAVSAHAIDGIKKAGVEAGMNEFLEKPISLGKLKTVLASFVETGG